MEAVKFEARKREKFGKGPSRQDRMAGFLPANLYGIEKSTLPLLINRRHFKNSFGRSVAKNPLVSLSISGAEKEERFAIVKEVQKHPVSRDLLHVDLYEVEVEKSVEVLVNITFEGVPVGVKQEGGTLSIQRKRVKIRCLPLDIPETVSLDMTHLKAGGKVLVRDLSAEKTIEFIDDPDLTIASVKKPRGGELREDNDEAESQGEEK